MMVTLELKAFAVVIFFCSFTKIPPPRFAVLEIENNNNKKKWKKFSSLSVFLACGVRRRGGGETGGGGECGILNISPSVPKFWYWTHFRKICEGKKGGEDSSAAGCIALVGWLSSVGFGIIVYYSFMIKPGAETWSSNIKSYRHVISLN